MWHEFRVIGQIYWKYKYERFSICIVKKIWKRPSIAKLLLSFRKSWSLNLMLIHSTAQVAVCAERHCTTDYWHATSWSHHAGTIRQLHWLVATHLRACQVQVIIIIIIIIIKFKVACLVHQSLSRQAPLYLADDCCLVPDSTRRSLWSADVPTCVVTPTLSSYGVRTFAAAGPRLWNSLPVQLRNPDITYGLFRRQPFVGKHERSALWLLICGALENIYLLTYLLNVRILTGSLKQHFLYTRSTNLPVNSVEWLAGSRATQVAMHRNFHVFDSLFSVRVQSQVPRTLILVCNQPATQGQLSLPSLRSRYMSTSFG